MCILCFVESFRPCPPAVERWHEQLCWQKACDGCAFGLCVMMVDAFEKPQMQWTMPLLTRAQSLTGSQLLTRALKVLPDS